MNLSVLVAAATSALQPPALAHSPQSDALLRRFLADPRAGQQPWTLALLKQCVSADADILFPGGMAQVAEACFDLMDREMLAATDQFRSRKISRRVRAAIVFRLDHAAPHRGAIRQALAVLLVPTHGRVLARALGRSVNAIWQAAGDTSTGFTYVTKRITLSGVYISTLLFWLTRGGNPASVEEFLDRRLAEVGRVTRLRNRLTGRIA
ncbi:COQ9 family protein [Komagataeibacter sp. FNDCR2]|uniref:COQ9 family protein n=1 Tax=Komagataeibacter sp. FNDCR2 TaxID=2878682 RepID=UPI001E560259|nr:COQ9 family protein [Komagataeibacter sp. FNDCR2]MCE2574912.1 COQ9 family protein [Komagataeibacter sp. FNDCR2]